MPTPQSSPYDDIPPDLSEPVRDDEVPPDEVRPVPPAPRPQAQPPARAASSTPAPYVPARGSNLSDEYDEGELDTSPTAGLVGVQAVERLLGGRIIEERDL